MAQEPQKGAAPRPTFIQRQKSLWMLGVQRVSPHTPSDRSVRAKQLASVIRLFGATVLAAALVWAILVLDWGDTSRKAETPSPKAASPATEMVLESQTSDEPDRTPEKPPSAIQPKTATKEEGGEKARLRPNPATQQEEEWSPATPEEPTQKDKEEPSTSVLRDPWE